MKKKNVIFGITGLVIATVALAAVTGDRLKSPVNIGQGQNVTETLTFDQGLGTSNMVLKASAGGELTFLNNSSSNILDFDPTGLLTVYKPLTALSTMDANGGWANDTNQDAGLTTRGLVSTGTQTFAGQKIFNSPFSLVATGGNVPHTCVIRTATPGGTGGSVSCNAGEIATGGGGRDSANASNVPGCYPGSGSTSTPATSWTCAFSSSGTLIIYAVCCQY